MAQSRLQKFASIFKRVEGFINSGAIKAEDKPIWFDVYKRFPPEKEPIYLRSLPEVKVRPIFYHEDKIRAEFYRVFGSPGVIELNDSSKVPLCDLFIEKYIEIAKSTEVEIDDVTLFKLAANRLREAGYQLRNFAGSNKIGLPDLEPPNRPSKQVNHKSQQGLNVASLMKDD